MDPLTDLPDKKESCVKKISLFSLIAAIVLFIGIIVVGVFFFLSTKEPSISKDSLIPEKGVQGKIEAAAAINGKLNIQPSPYYRHPNFYDSKPTSTIALLEKFKTYQQTNNGSCGASAALMVLTFYNEKDLTEEDLAKETLYYPDSTPEQLEKVFKNRNYKTISSVESSKQGTTYWTDNKKFATDVKQWLNKKIPILVKLGGHWSVIIGYDDFGKTEDVDYQNHVLILADSWDTHDHQQDGYIIYTFDYFWNLWTNMAVKSEGLYQQFVVGFKE